jgi:hypothetical protein
MDLAEHEAIQLYVAITVIPKFSCSLPRACTPPTIHPDLLSSHPAAFTILALLTLTHPRILRFHAVAQARRQSASYNIGYYLFGTSPTSTKNCMSRAGQVSTQEVQ